MSRKFFSFPIRGRACRGQALVPVVVFGAVALLLLTGLAHWGSANVRSAQRSVARERAIQVAEAGIEYYRWHLAQAPQDYQDGTSGSGPYIHDLRSAAGVVVGQFRLTITPPTPGSSAVTIHSVGSATGFPDIRRAIDVRLAMPTVAQYAILADDPLRIGSGTEVFGAVHVNGGIHFDGLAHNLVTSARDVYKDPDHSGNDEFGVHTHVLPVDPPPPIPVPARPDVFAAGRTFPVPAIDFDAIAGDLAKIKAAAQSGGLVFAGSGTLGYHLVLKTNDTFDLSRVTRVVPLPNGCTKVLGEQGWGTWSIDTGGEAFIGTYPFPQNGLVFLEDHVWVDGRIDGARLTIASGVFPEQAPTRTNIIMNRDLRYTNTDGRDSLGLIAQGNVNVGMMSADDLRIDAALLAQRGRVGRHYYRPPTQNQDRCSPYHVRQRLTLYGMIATKERYGFAYTDGTGYQNRTITYDANLRLNPPPNFPLVGSAYELVSWEEVSP